MKTNGRKEYIVFWLVYFYSAKRCYYLVLWRAKTDTNLSFLTRMKWVLNVGVYWSLIEVGLNGLGRLAFGVLLITFLCLAPRLPDSVLYILVCLLDAEMQKGMCRLFLLKFRWTKQKRDRKIGIRNVTGINFMYIVGKILKKHGKRGRKRFLFI